MNISKNITNELLELLGQEEDSKLFGAKAIKRIQAASRWNCEHGHEAHTCGDCLDAQMTDEELAAEDAILNA